MSKFILISFSLLMLLLSLVVYLNIKDLKPLKLNPLENNHETSYIYNKDDILVKEIKSEIDYYVSYEMLPKHFINALIAIEDETFFTHKGYNLKRIISAFFLNLKAKEKKQGASTLTQQLVKNYALTNEKTYNRKIKELYLAIKLEKDYSKEEILTYYCNYISFEGTKRGVNYAAKRLFNKHIKDVNLIESVILASLVKSPTLYNPLINIDNSNKRKNRVLKKMKELNYLSNEEYLDALNTKVEEVLNPYKPNVNYDYQAYIDNVYLQLNNLNVDPYEVPLKIYTNLDITLQSELDKIQNSTHPDIKINNPLLIPSLALINNNTQDVEAVMGGLNYQGEKIYNRASMLKSQVASTIKPLLSYALAYEALHLALNHYLIDEPLSYPNDSKIIKNVDNKYLGELNLVEALGYSRNTIALKLLMMVIDAKGVNYVTNYLKKLNLLDDDTFNYSYALGTLETSPLNLAAAYCMISNLGIYKKPSFIRYYTTIKDNKNHYINYKPQRILSKEASYLTKLALKEIIDKNYYNIALCKPNDVVVFAKSGTSNFDEKTLAKYQIPSDASKSIWMAGFTSTYSIAIHCGFDSLIKGKKTYFTKNDKDNTLAKRIFKLLASFTKDNNYLKSDNLVSVNLVKGFYPYVLANEFMKPSKVFKGLVNKDYAPFSYYQFNKLNIDLDYYKINDEYVFNFPLLTSLDLYPNYEYHLLVNDKHYISKEKVIKIKLNPLVNYKIKGYVSFENNPQIISNIVSKDIFTFF